MADDKRYILDPLTSLCKVALLHFMPKRTRLAINHHVLVIQDYNYYQWLERSISGDKRLNIANLNTPLIKALKWYVLEDGEQAEMNASVKSSIRCITEYAIKGLKKLKNQTYSDDLAMEIILQYLINRLTDALNDTFDNDACVNITNNNLLSEKIKNNYDAQTVESVAKMLVDADTLVKSGHDASALIDCAHKLLTNRDTQFTKLMHDVTTTL